MQVYLDYDMGSKDSFLKIAVLIGILLVVKVECI